MIEGILFDANGVLYGRDPNNPPQAIRLVQGAKETLSGLRAKGFKLGVVTNSAHSAAAKISWLIDAGLDIKWDCFISSADVGVAKPDPLVFHLALRRCRVAPSAALFVGHSAEELSGARQAGIGTVGIENTEPTIADFTIAKLKDLTSLVDMLATQESAD